MNNINLLSKNKCCGCRSCEQSCPKKCIKMIDDNEGFLTPNINEKACVDCGICVKVCPILDENIKKIEPKVYAAKNNNTQILLDSTSGGMFDIFARYILEKNGYVFGCAWSKDLVAEHIQIDNIEDLSKLHSSKYVQSNTKDTFTKVKTLLDQDKYVLYSGVSCQIAGLKSFLKKDYDKLLTVDIICHGVPSPLLFEKYKMWLSDKMKGNVTSFNFRTKENAPWGLTYKAKTNNKTTFKSAFIDPYYVAFLESKTYRECCYTCKYANKNKESDITLGDYWGIEKVHPEFFDDKGVSVVILNTQKANDVFNVLNDKITSIRSDYDKALKRNRNLAFPSKRHTQRDTIYANIKEISPKEIFDVRLKLGLKIKARIKNMIPYKLKVKIKKIIK